MQHDYHFLVIGRTSSDQNFSVPIYRYVESVKKDQSSKIYISIWDNITPCSTSILTYIPTQPKNEHSQEHDYNYVSF